MLFADTQLAARLERAECQMLRDAAEATRLRGKDVLIKPVAGGVATFTGAGSPLNKVAGLGFRGAPSEEDIESIEREWRRRGTAVQVEVSSLADPQVCTLLTRRGYELRGFENVLGCRLNVDTDAARAPAVLLSDAHIVVSPSEAEELALWTDVVVTGFMTPDAQGAPAHESFPRDVLERVIGETADARGVRRYLARIEGVPVGGASMKVVDGVAQLAGAATLPKYRRRGVQSAMLRARLEHAGRAGCDVAVVTTLPGSKSQENAQKKGFQILYTRVLLVREPG